MISPEETNALADQSHLYEEVRRAEQDFRDVRDVARALDAKGAEARARSGRAIAALHQAGVPWVEIARITGLSRTTLLRRAQPYLEERPS